MFAKEGDLERCTVQILNFSKAGEGNVFSIWLSLPKNGGSSVGCSDFKHAPKKNQAIYTEAILR